MLSQTVNNAGKPLGNHLLPTGIRACIMAASFWVLSVSFTNQTGSIAAFVGCIFGCYLIDRYLNRPPLASYRTVVIVAAASLILIAGLLAGNLITASRTLAELMTPINSYNLSEFVKWFLVSATVTASLRSVATRTSLGSILEIVFVAAAFIITLSAHRNGMIHRPYFIGDFALMRGLDPSSILMAMGCGAVLCLAALLMMENNHRRLPFHFSVLGLLCFSLLAYVQMFGLPTPRYTDDLGLTGSEQDSRGSQSDNPFRDGENNADNLEAPVAIVLFRDDYEPLNGSYYFRETAYSQWNGKLLDVATRADMDLDLVDHFPVSRYEVTEPLPGLADRVPVRTSIGMLTAHRTPFGLETPVAVTNTPNPNNLRFKRTYDVESMSPVFDFDELLGMETGAEDWSEEVREEYLRLPDDPRYGQLASQLVANLRPEYADDPFAKAFSIKTYLDENGIYSLKNAHAYETDPAASFLFGDLTGYCMHFAFAATYMFRSLGIPARVGIGYSVPASNRAGGSALLVQAIHGHAWPEVYFRDLGWVIIDPAPQQTLVDMTTSPQNSLQQLLGDMLRNEASFDDFMAQQEGSAIPLQLLLNIFYALVLATLISGYSIKYYRLWMPAAATGKQQYRLRYRALLDRLSAVGIRRRAGESREAFARRIADVTPSFTPLTQQHLYYALGPDQSAPASVRDFDWAASSQHITHELQQKLPLWKRCLAAINPFSWLLSR